MSTVNYRSGLVLDYLQFWLNYQIEHHLFPDIPMTSYAALAPKVRALCAEYGVPYRQQPLLKRLPAMARVFVGEEAMPIVEDRDALRHCLG